MTPPKRHQTQTERDIDGAAARKKRDKLAIPHEIEPEKTDVTTPPSPELLEVRERRTTLQRVERLLEYARSTEEYRNARELREAQERAVEKRRRWIVAVIAAVGAAVATVIGAVTR